MACGTKLSKVLLTFIFLLASSVLSYASPFNIRISLSGASPSVVGSKHIKSHAILVVSTKITNISNVPQRLHIMTCSYGNSWIPSSDKIFVGLENCRSNHEKTIILKPKQEYRRPLLIAITSKAREGVFSFQLGFSRNIISPYSRTGVYSRHRVLKAVTWSNHLRVRVKRKMLPYLMEVSKRTRLHSRKDFEKLTQGK